MRIVTHDFAGALAAYERALQLVPAHPEARRGRAVARRKLGEDVLGDSISVVPYTGPPSQRVLDVVALLSLQGGNVVLDELFDSRHVRLIKLMVDLHGDASLPVCDVIFNAIGDVDCAPDALGKAADLVRGCEVRVLNHPDSVRSTGRIAQANRLATLGARTPRIRRVEPANLSLLDAPVLVRAPGYHAGRYFERLDSDTDRSRVVQSMPPGELLAIEWIDTRDPHGMFAKYRVVAIDGALYPAHLAISSEWKVHYFSAEMASSAAYRAREQAFLQSPKDAIGEAAWDLLERIASGTGLQYAGIDFALDARGEVVAFECNATMAVRYPPDEPLWAYRRPAVDAIREAFTRMMRRYSST
jgi:hypothetical protein